MFHFFRMLRIVVLESWRLLHRGSVHAEGWITPAFRVLLWFLSLPSTVVIDMAGFRYRALPKHLSSRAGARITDSFVAACVLWEIVFYLLGPEYGLFAVAGMTFATWRIIDVCSVLLRMVFFDRASGWKHATEYEASRERAVILSLLNYVEVIFCFAIIYQVFLADLRTHTSPIDRLSALYFSGITQMTIGFGDVVPIGGVRLIALTQSLIGVLMLTIFVSRFVASLGPSRSFVDRDGDGR